MPKNTSRSQSDDWRDKDFPTLFQARLELVESIRSHLEELAELTRALQERARDAGVVTLEVDDSALVEAVEKLARRPRPRSAPAVRGRRTTRRREKPRRYALVWRKSGETVVDDAGEPVTFKTKVRILRGPRYREIVGDRIGDVQLVDSLDGGKVIHETLEFGPAPGRRPG